ncbi:MAG: MFS transporter [Rhizobiaceae bacterium]
MVFIQGNLAASKSPDSGPGLLLITTIAFLTLVDLFAAQAILPSLVTKFEVSRATMGFAVNASTLGMAAAGLLVALLAPAIDRRKGIWVSLAILSVPTTLLALTDNIVVFALLRIVQGLCMATAFTLTMAFLAETLAATAVANALAAYVTGNVASNLFGRIFSAGVADVAGIEGNFLAFAILNLAGAYLAFKTVRGGRRTSAPHVGVMMRGWRGHLANRPLRRVFAIGFLILFVFLGAFTYVNFRLVEPPFSLSPMALGLVYLVFAPSMLTTPIAGRYAGWLGVEKSIVLALMLAILGLLSLLSTHVVVALAGLAAVAVGTFLAQAIATGQIGRLAATETSSASGIYLASYYLGGLIGSLVLGQVFDKFGWAATIATLVVALSGAICLARNLATPSTMTSPHEIASQSALSKRASVSHS